MSTIILGVDPGETTGVFVMPSPWGGEHCALQIRNRYAATDYLTHLVDEFAAIGHATLIAAEQFVVGQRAARSRNSAAGREAREILGVIVDLGARPYVTTVIRNAATVKPWATDKRLDAAGLLAPTAGMRHARDGARHALYAAVHDGLMRDPLSKAGA